MCQNSLPSGGDRSLGAKISGERVVHLPIHWYHSKGNWLRYNFATDIFYIMELCSRLFILYCRHSPKDDKFTYFNPILRKLGGRRTLVDGSLQACVEFLLSVINFFLSLTVEALQGKLCQNLLPSGRVGHLEPRFQGRGCPWGIFFGFYKTRHILLSDSANCTVLRAVILIQYRRVTDRQTDRQTDRRNCRS